MAIKLQHGESGDLPQHIPGFLDHTDTAAKVAGVVVDNPLAQLTQQGQEQTRVFTPRAL